MSSSPKEPMAALPPDTETEWPNPSSAAPSIAVSLSCSLQTLADRAKTYAAPVDQSSPGAPTKAVPLSARAVALPKLSFGAPSLAVILSRSLQTFADRV